MENGDKGVKYRRGTTLNSVILLHCVVCFSNCVLVAHLSSKYIKMYFKEAIGGWQG